MEEKLQGREQMMELFKTLGHPVRFKIMDILLSNDEQFCGDLVEVLGMAQSTVSHHLKILRQSGLVETEMKGTWVCYRVNRNQLQELARFINEWT
ncbi:MAG: helix-turn-helix transcriptional regulator [Bacillaceae bacterium]|nr:helix-turn-helix transcriptional regulator [Bacillaceae bacterium]